MNDDRRLGMDRPIARRDFLDGMAATVAARTAGGPAESGAAGPYPPAREGLCGQDDASYAVAHRLRDGTFWNAAPEPHDTGESYDLVVVGAGISGLAAAYFYRQRVPGARVLIVETLDDFGGHAKRNEFHVRGRTLLSNGGTQAIEEPSRYSAVARGLLHELGVETKRFYRYYDRERYDGLGTGVFFDRETFGEDRVVAGMGSRPWRDFLAQAPLSAAVRADIERLYTQPRDYLPGRSVAEKRRRLARLSYADFLTQVAGCGPGVLPFFKTWTNDLFGLDIDATAALDVYEAGDDYGFVTFPGFAGLGLDGTDAAMAPRGDPYIFHFPDGNATIARLLVRALVPGVLGGTTMEDVVTARARYGRLDAATGAVRVRLNSTVARVRHMARGDVEVAYVRGTALESVRAKHAILACWNTMIPYLCPDVPAAQREALAYGVKVPLVYTHVAVRNWRAFAKLGVRAIHAPGSYHSLVTLDFPVDIGSYRSPRTPADPMVLWMLRTPCLPGLSNREQHRAGRRELYATAFATLERRIRSQLARMLGPAGFDPARDIAAITVNRWSHGYAYEYSSLWDPPFPAGRTPAELGRTRVGRISIANSDAAASAYTDAAIDQAHRAVREQLERAAPRAPI